MDIGPNQKLYFSGGTDSKAYWGDVEGNFGFFSEITTGEGFTLGCQFYSVRNFYMVNRRGVEMIPESGIVHQNPTLLIEPQFSMNVALRL